MKNVLSRKGYFAILVDIIVFLIGIVLILFKSNAINILLYGVSILLVVFGIYKCIMYYKNNHKSDDFSFAYGTIMILISIFIVLCMDNVILDFNTIVGLGIIFSGIMKINMAVQVERDRMWRLILFIALLIIFAGIFVIAYPSIIVVHIGIILVVYSVLSIFESLMYIRNVNKIVG